MKLTFVIICALAIDLACVVEGIKKDLVNEEPHKGEYADCVGARMRLSNQMKEVKCMPRKTLVKLRPENGYAYLPDIVSVNRCGGLCGSILSCMPKETTIVPILIRRHNVISGGHSCYNVHVEEHTKCKCGCKVKEHHCNKSQVYIEDECACKCMNSVEEAECSLVKGMAWNPETCKCTCVRSEEECSTGLEWIPSLCRCAKVMAMPNNEV